MIRNGPQAEWQTVGWSRIGFKMPPAWQIGTIGKDYLVLVDDAGPVMEVKCGKVAGKFSHQIFLSRLAALNRKKNGGRLHAYPLPPDWHNALRNKDVSCFIHKSGDAGGKGLILHFPQCSGVVLIQFYRRTGVAAESVCPRVLASFHDQTDKNLVKWSVFHLRAEIPKAYRLEDYRFEAGLQEMRFGFKRQAIALYCWGPAEIVLGDGNLSAFAAARLSLPAVEPSQAIDNSGDVSWTWAPPAPSSGAWRSMVLKRPFFEWVRVWHHNRRNRILAVAARGAQPFESDCLEKICAAYECV